MATWAMRQRYAWIEARLAAGRSFNRDDVVQAFTVTKQTATATVNEYRALHPGALRYDAARKAFVSNDTPSLGSLRQTLIEQARAAIATGGREQINPTMLLDHFGEVA